MKRFVTKYELAQLAGVHPSTVAVWLHFGLDEAIAEPGRGRRPALFDARKALAWITARDPYFAERMAAMNARNGRTS